MASIFKFALLLILIFLTKESRWLQTDSIQLNTQTLGIQKDPDFWRIRFLCTSRIGSCFFQFLLLPENWTTEGQKVLIPISDTTKTRAYLLQVAISQPTGITVRKQIVLFFSDGEIEIRARDRPDQVVSARVEDMTEQVVKQEKSQFISKDREDLSWLEENGIIPFIPSINLLDQVIKEGNIVEIVRLIQNIVSDKSDCQLKVDYLRTLNTRFTQYIVENQKLLQQEKATIDQASSDLQRLREQKDKLETELKNFDNAEKARLKGRQAELQKERVQTFTKFNTFTIVSNRYKSLFELSVDSSGVNPSELMAIEKEVEEDEEEIQNINKQIQDLMEQKELLEGKVQGNKKKIKDTIAVGKVTPQKIRSLEENFKKFSAQATQYKFKYEEAERQLQAVKEALSKLQTSEDNIDETLEEVSRKIRDLERGQDTRELIQLQQLVSTLKRNRPNVEDALAKCEQTMQKKGDENVVIAILNPPIVRDTKEEVKIPPRQQFVSSFSLLQKINIFSTQWVIRFGVPTAQNFNCAVVNEPGSGYGMIVGIQNAMMRIRDENQRLVGLYLGVCSQIRAQNEGFVPEVGDLIDWQGDLVSPNVANVHRARIFRSA